MPIRSLNGLDYSVRSLNGLSNVIDYSVSLPLTMDSDYNIKLSNLNHYRDFISVNDICSAINLLYSKKYKGIINICSGPSC